MTRSQPESTSSTGRYTPEPFDRCLPRSHVAAGGVKRIGRNTIAHKGSEILERHRIPSGSYRMFDRSGAAKSSVPLAPCLNEINTCGWSDRTSA